MPVVLCQCVTTQEAAVQKNPPIMVEGTLFYPDDADQTYIVPDGAEIIGACGHNCRYIVKSGGRMTAHSGTNNVYRIEDGGGFKGFDHPAENCQVKYAAGAKVEQVEAGRGVVFSPLR